MEATKTKIAKANARDSKSNMSVKKSRFADHWERYPNGCGEILDYRAVLK
jgi:hypothetical protein